MLTFEREISTKLIRLYQVQLMSDQKGGLKVGGLGKHNKGALMTNVCRHVDIIGFTNKLAQMFIRIWVLLKRGIEKIMLI